MNKRLSLRVKAVNMANQYAKSVYPLLNEYFKQFVGQKINKADGSLLKKVADNLPNLKREDMTIDGCHYSFMVYRNSSNYTLSYSVKVCVSNGDGCAYQEAATVSVGDYKNCLLENVRYEMTSRRVDYTVEEIVDARKKIEDAKKVVSELERAVNEFGMYDN